MRDAGWIFCWAVLAVFFAVAPAAAAEAASPVVADYRIVDGAIPAPLAGLTGDAERGRAIVLDRAVGNCLICHSVPVPGERFQGELGPDLAGVGSRLPAARIRMALVDQSRVNPETLMPPYHRTHDLRRVGKPFRGKPALTAQEIEDVVVWLVSLK
jgi:L-cysteine S-thiosulfotransferase